MSSRSFNGQHPRVGFTLVELMVTLSILMALLVMAIPLFSAFINDNRLRQDVARVEGVISRTMSECLGQGRVGRVVIEDGTVTGSVQDEAGNWSQMHQMSLTFSQFGRGGRLLTPWLQDSEVGVASTYPVHTIPIQANGVVQSSGVVYLSYSGKDAALELLVSGAIVTFFAEQEGTAWSK